jgi:hypothetical protein
LARGRRCVFPRERSGGSRRRRRVPTIDR